MRTFSRVTTEQAVFKTCHEKMEPTNGEKEPKVAEKSASKVGVPEKASMENQKRI